MTRDHETLRRVAWHRLALDEAQFIKTPPTKQATVIRELPAAHRPAPPRTPAENRLIELALERHRELKESETVYRRS